MKGLVCEYCESNWESTIKGGGATCGPSMREVKTYKKVLCVSDVLNGVVVADEKGEVFTVKICDLVIIKPGSIPAFFDDWRIQMGFESWNQYAD